MLPPLIQRPRRRAVDRPRERGVTLALVALAIFSIIAMAGLSIDVGTLYQASAEAQRAADAAALAAARVISMSGITGDPANASSSWQQICGGTSSPATQAAAAVAQQNLIGGAPPSSTTVTYSASTGAVSSGNSDCSASVAAFGVNPVVTVKVTQTSLATYFARIWGRTGSSVSATASAEVFNPSNSGAYASGSNLVPVQPRCVKPWIVPNSDPLHPPGTCTGCTQFVDPTTGSIQSPGIFANNPVGVIGEKFWLLADCTSTKKAPCTLLGQPQANYTGGARVPPNLEYVPGQATFASIAIPSDGSDACSAVADAGTYAQAIAGCDQSTQYQCGKPLQNVVDLSENPGTKNGDTTNGIQCLIHQGMAGGGSGALGQDVLEPLGAPPTYPFQIHAGTSNPLLSSGVKTNDFITSSTSIVSLPIYDTATTINNTGGTTAVTIVGFLQVFINFVDDTGNINVSVLNVSGCGNAAPGTALTGTSPVPVRLITPP
jgi:Flp pilus assembly protein TadG